MDIRQLKTFITIAETHSFTQTAQRLDYAQSTATTQIHILERELGVKLFERLGHSITLTSAGNCLLPFAAQIIKLTDEAKLAVEQSREIGGSLSIGAVESLCVTRLPRVLKEYRHRYPNVEITIKFGVASDFPAALQNNTIDVAFFFCKESNHTDSTVEIDLPEKFGLFVYPEHPLAGLTDIYPKDLNGHALILTEPGCSYRKMFENMLSSFNIKPQSIIETGNIQTIKQLVMSGMGVTLLPLCAIEQECHEGRMVQLNWRGPTFDLHAQVIRHKSKWISPQLNAFIQLLHQMSF